MSMVVDASAVNLDANDRWTVVCPATSLTLDRGSAAIFGDQQIAIFRISTGGIYALENHDPFSNANVISRGIVGHTAGHLKVASPMYKQSFDLETGICLDDPSVSLRVFPIEERDEIVYVDLTI